MIYFYSHCCPKCYQYCSAKNTINTFETKLNSGFFHWMPFYKFGIVREYR